MISDHCDRDLLDIPDLVPSAEYQNASPFPHAVFHSLFSDPFLELLIKQSQLRLHNTSMSQKSTMPLYSIAAVRLVDLCRSREMISFVERLSGIDGLTLPQPPRWIIVDQNGFLKVHRDLGYSPKDGYRIVNALLYLNRRPHDTGNLQLWSENPPQCVKQIVTDWNTMVIFTNTSNAFHGHPCLYSGQESRYAIQWYYWSHDSSAARWGHGSETTEYLFPKGARK